MTILHLGVVDVGYTNVEGAKTTGEVAQILEDKYQIMELFYKANKERIDDWVAQGLIGELENVMAGKPIVTHESKTRLGRRVLKGSTINSRIEERFRDFLALREWKDISGQRIEAAEKGVSHRKKRPTVKANQARAEFIDTGLYQATFRAWVD